MRDFSTDEILAIIKKKGYKIYMDGSSNLIGIRANYSKANSFDDMLYNIEFINGKFITKFYQITTDPGTPNLIKPINTKGAAILKPGQYLGMWAVGKHRGKYNALVQVKPCTVIRDNNRNNTLDFNSKIEETGLFGINCHKATSGITSKVVGAYSAGCQVHADAIRFDNEFMGEMQKLAATYGNSFTYTLLEERDF